MPGFMGLNQTSVRSRNNLLDRDRLIDSVSRDRWAYWSPILENSDSEDSLDVLCSDGSSCSSYTVYDEVRRSAGCGLPLRLLVGIYRNVGSSITSFTDKLSSIYSRNKDDGDVYCTKSNVHKAVTYALYSSRDLNRLLTENVITRNYDKRFNSQWKVGTKMRGRTSLGRYSFPFPVDCSAREFVNFLDAMEARPRADRISMFQDGIVPNHEVERLYLRIFPRTTYASPYMGKEEIFGGIKILSTIMLIFEAIKNKDVATLGLLCTQNLDIIERVAQYMGVAFANFKEFIIDYFHSTTVVTQSSTPSSTDWVSLLPGVARQSPLVQKVISLATFLMTAQFLKESSLWQHFNEVVGPDFQKISERTFGATLFYQVIMVIWEGYKRMADYTDWRGLIGISRDASFMQEVREMMISRQSSRSSEEIKRELTRIDELFLSRTGLTNSHAVERALQFLVERKKSLICLEEHYAPRDVPTLIWLNGPPGTGKTTLVEAIKDYLSKRDGVARCLGDTIIYNVNDKYPVEASALWDARYLEMNDIESNYSKFSQEGKVPLDIVLQMILDTYPLTFQAAFEKGVIYSKIKYLFITSNHMSYKMSGDTAKLQRRLDRGILFDYTFKDGCSYNSTLTQPIDFRNDQLKFVQMEAICRDLHIGFRHTQLSFDFTQIFSYMDRVIDNLMVENERTHKLIRVDGQCACGMTRAFHLRGGAVVNVGERCDIAPGAGVVSPPTVPRQVSSAARGSRANPSRLLHENKEEDSPPREDKEGETSAPAAEASRAVDLLPTVSEECEEEERLLLFSDDEEEKREDIPLAEAYVIAEPYSTAPSGSGISVPSMELAFIAQSYVPELTTVVCYATLTWWVLQLLTSRYCKYSVDFVRSNVYGPWLWNYYTLVITMLGFVYSWGLPLWRLDARAIKVWIKYYILKQAICSVKDFLRKHAAMISVLGITAVVGTGLLARGPRKVQAQGVTRSNYDKNSMTTSVVSTKQFMPSDARSWSNPSPVRRIELQTRHVNADNLLTKVKNATVPADFGDPDTQMHSKGHIFFLNSSYICVNKHYLTTQVNGKTELRDITYCKVGVVEFIIYKKDVMSFDETEICLVRNTIDLCAENLTRFLPSGVLSASFDGVYVATGESCTVRCNEDVTLENGERYSALGAKLDSKKGDCGNMLIGSINGEAFIAGMLFAGASVGVFGHRTFFCQIPANSYDELRVVIPEPNGIETLSGRSELFNDPHDNLWALGTNPGEGKNNFRTAYRKTRLYDRVAPKLSMEYSIIKAVSGNVSAGNDYVHGSAWKHTFKRFDLPNCFPATTFREAAYIYFLRVKEAPIVKLAPLSLEEAFFGLESIGVEGFPLDTSAGPYWRKLGYKKKRDLFTETDEGLYAMRPEFVAAVQIGLDNLDAHVIVAPHVEMAAKDEIRPATKVRDFNIRLFSVVDADYNIIVRMYLMPLITYLLKHKTFSECFGQMHAASRQWTDLKDYLCETGFTRFADMDFSAFDTCHDAKVFDGVADVFFFLAQHVGYSDEDALKTRHLVRSMSVQLCQYKGDYFVKTKGMPSGVILTLIMNSVANSLLMRIVFASLTGLPMDDFSKHVRLATVGDDNIHSFSDEVSDKFTMEKAVPIYKALGYTITPASKAGAFVDHMPLEDLTFVKRKFVLWDDGLYRAPLDPDSIYKAFCFETNRSGESSIDRLSSVFTSGLYESYLHGREFFQTFVEDMSKIFDEYDLPYSLMTFEELDEIFKSRGMVTIFA